MALTTTTGDFFNRLSTIRDTRSIASALSTEVPPNFMTIMPEAPEPLFRLRYSGNHSHKRKTHPPFVSAVGLEQVPYKFSSTKPTPAGNSCPRCHSRKARTGLEHGRHGASILSERGLFSKLVFECR